MATPHNKGNVNDFAKTVLMPGDPLRAQFIANTYLQNPKLVNSVRNMLAYTGTYKGKEVTVMGSGMGMPSIGIYSYELFKFYDVDQIIRIGSCGTYQENIQLFDIIIAQGASTDSNYASQYQLPGSFSALASYDLLQKAIDASKKRKANFHVGNILSSDIFYRADGDAWKKWQEMGILGVEMESYALYCNAAYLHKKALTILTVSDSLVNHQETTAEEREKSFTEMMEIALDLI